MPDSPTSARSGAPHVLDGGPLTVFDVQQVARHGRIVELGREGRARLEACNQLLTEAIAAGRTMYGINTGFGSFAHRRVSGDDLRNLQRNLIRSHAAGVGELLPDDIVRGMILMLAGSLSRGHSGVRPIVVETLIGMLNGGVTPCVPRTGSVGASGDLAPLAHVAQVMIGEGTATLRTEPGTKLDGAEALRRAGVTPITLEAKEGLALINGTHLMASIAALAVADCDRLMDAAVAAAAMSMDACRATDTFLDERVHILRNQSGPARVAARLRNLLEGSQIIPSHAVDDPRVQDPYSLRCAPPVIGAALDALDYVRERVEAELCAVTDNPLIFPAAEGERSVVSAGNFHGMPLAVPLDLLAIAMSHVAGIAERRIYFILAASDQENPLNPHLSPVPGLHSGLMITQYTAAACCNEIATLCAPASVINIPTCAGMEDYNSFGPRAGMKARRAVELATRVVAIELLVAGEAMEYQRPLRSGAGVERAHAVLRTTVERLTADRSPAPDIEAIARLIRTGRFGY
ncbi:MAG: histidine ammonia-lyase [Phycisphaerales bacterium]|nr:histidine ammonia-lyase [Phycisphaerales bacterium]